MRDVTEIEKKSDFFRLLDFFVLDILQEVVMNESLRILYR